ncbi:hypothetical protein QBC33DRAFT_561270 [Phialemonium atrogriseum]|uniref:Uncharacterized protein n=1 Tax=Phialemonium atrogriseum TaxID=1093897 RepID=A0AAJ0BVY6_9PEZI|nr:uncharacterized protein QBC33DRAFT_561270 [Phialemonium atrogriseum]KAK1764987.1 hypothetical protein QBC33DRAFT_561270 [Phialemonium atrogriseum]
MAPVLSKLPASRREIIVTIDYGASRLIFGRGDPHGPAGRRRRKHQNSQDRPGSGFPAPFAWIKLFLLHEGDWPPHALGSPILRKAAGAARSLSMGPVRLTTAYLEHLWDKVRGFIARKLCLSPEEFRGLCMRVIFTVPAVWPEDALRRMEAAIRASGILDSTRESSFTFMREPAAAADTVTYEVATAADGNYIVHERGPGASRLCGGVFLHDGFSKLFEEKICNIAAGDTEILQKLRPHFRDMAFTWWGRLVEFLWTEPSESDSFILPFEVEVEYPGAQESYPGAPGHIITFSGAEIASILSPVIGEIVNLVRGQIRATREVMARTPTYVFLTGGLGSNLLLQESLRLNVESPTKMITYSDTRGLTFVCRGATVCALRGYSPGGRPVTAIQSHLALANYGILLGDAPTARIDWVIRKGSPLSSTNPVSHAVPAGAWMASPAIGGGILNALTICCMTQPAPPGVDASIEGLKTLCRVAWKRNTAVAGSGDTVALEVTHDSLRGIALAVCCNGRRLGSESVFVEYFFATEV